MVAKARCQDIYMVVHIQSAAAALQVEDCQGMEEIAMAFGFGFSMYCSKYNHTLLSSLIPDLSSLVV